MDTSSKVYIAGHNGMVGSSIVRALDQKGYSSLILKSRAELDLLDQAAVSEFFKKNLPDYVFICAAKVGGILANNTYRGEFLYENLQIQNNLIHCSHIYNVKKLLFLGSSCIYPRDSKQPMKEEALLTGSLEPTNEPYAVAKIAGIKMCENYFQQYGSDFFSIMPTNTYGPNDNYDLQSSHVLPALIRKVHNAKKNRLSELSIWGSGSPLREFLYVDDLADAAIFVMGLDYKTLYEKGLSHLNVGSGKELTIKELVLLIAKKLKYNGKIIFDKSKPDGMPRKLMDSSKLERLGWVHKTTIDKGIEIAYEEFVKKYVQ